MGRLRSRSRWWCVHLGCVGWRDRRGIRVGASRRS